MSEQLQRHRFVLLGALLALACLGLLRGLLPWTGVGADGTVYAAMARHPFHTAHQLGPYPFRFLIPLLAWLLPLSANAAFHVLVFVGLVVGSVATALLARDLGIRAGRALLAVPLYVLSFAGVYGLYQYRMIDAESAAFTASALLLAWRGRRRAFVVVGVLAACAREYGATVPLAWWAAHRGRGREVRAIVEAVVLGLPIVLAFVLIQFLVPHPAGGSFAFRNGAYSYYEHFGLARYIARSVVQAFGLMFVVWPVGFLLGTPRWRSFHLYVLGVIPVLSVTDLDRVFIYLLPFVIPSTLLVLERASNLVAVAAVAASAYVAVLLSFHNLPNNGGYPAGAAMIVPGALVCLIAFVPAVWNALGELRGALQVRFSPHA